MNFTFQGMKRIQLLSLFLLLLGDTAFGQLYPNRYRPVGQEWAQLENERFRIIYPSKYEAIALRTASILEREYAGISRRLGSRLEGFPVILNMESDRGGGFVSPFNFRSEVEGAPHRGKIINPRSGGWLEFVLPHELVHALHFNLDTPSFSSLTGLISPDIRRSIHAAAPLGVHEGIAVLHETRHTPFEAGRGNHAYFTGRVPVTPGGSPDWTPGQHLHPSGATLPLDRHYLGSYLFMEWLQRTYGEPVIREALLVHYRLPFLGFGHALRSATGKWPAELFRSYGEERVSHSVSATYPASGLYEKIGPSGKYRGASIRKPIWTDPDRILFHAEFYNAPTGFYLFDLSDRNMILLLEQRISNDYRYRFDPENRTLWFSEFRASGRYDRVFHSELYAFSLSGNKRKSLTDTRRLHSPSVAADLYALRTEGDAHHLVSIDWVTGETKVHIRPGEGDNIEEVLQHPSDSLTIAVIARRGESQSIWIGNEGIEGIDLENVPVIGFENGSVYDLEWHPSEKRLLFSADHHGTLSIFEYDHEIASIHEFTGDHRNRFEAAYSPDGQKVAFILQDGPYSLPVVAKLDALPRRSVPEREWSPSARITDDHRETTERPSLSDEWTIRPYSTGLSWMLPRTALPWIRRHSGGFREAGFSLLSTDPLSRHSYTFRAGYLEERAWFDLDYSYSGFWPGLGFSLFHRPNSIRHSDPSGAVQYSLASRTGGGVNIPVRYTFEQSTRLTRLFIRPSFTLSEVRSLTNTPVYIHERLYETGLGVQLQYRLRQYIRNAQPNAGWLLSFTADITPGSTPLENSFESAYFGGRYGFRTALYRYLAPFPFSNHSLRTGIRFLSQSRSGPYDPRTFFHPGFIEDPCSGADRAGTFETRYTIPVAHPDDGGVVLPAYLESVYIVLFTETAARLDPSSTLSFFDRTRTLYGAGIRIRSRLSNLRLDLGIGVAIEPTRNRWSVIAGPF